MAKIHLTKVDEHIDKQLVFKAGDIEKLVGKRSHLKFLVKENRIVSLGSGYYSAPRLSRFDSLILILQKYFPQAVISGASALYLHGILDEPPDTVEADILNTTSQRSHLFDFSRVASSRMIGTEIKSLHGKELRIYEVERALADLILKKVDPQIIRAAVTGYFEKFPHKNNARIDELDAALGTNLRRELNEVFLKINYRTPPVPTERQIILETAISMFAHGGSCNLNPRSLAQECNVSLRKINQFFKNKSEILEAVFGAVHDRIMRTGSSAIYHASRPSKEWLTNSINAYMDIIDKDPITFRIQRWCIAEQNLHQTHLLKIWNDLLDGIVETVLKENDLIDRKTAESRSLLFLSLIDQYATLKWYIARHLKMESRKTEIIQNFKHEILKQAEDLLFGP